MNMKSYISLLLFAVACSNFFIYSDLLTSTPCKTNADCPIGARCYPAGSTVNGTVLDKSVCTAQPVTYPSTNCNPACQSDQFCVSVGNVVRGKMSSDSACTAKGPVSCWVWTDFISGNLYQVGCGEGQVCNFNYTCVPNSGRNV